MAKRRAKILHCPSCNSLVLKDAPEFPFCSDRCQRIDLGKWASGAYRISSPILDPEVYESLPPGTQSSRDDDAN